MYRHCLWSLIETTHNQLTKMSMGENQFGVEVILLMSVGSQSSRS